MNKYYVGTFTDREERIYEHNIGHTKFTSTGIPWQLIYKEEFETIALAKKKEVFVKKQKSRIYIGKLIKNNQ